jgi:polysaccharide biosynthesis/export protein VpsN
MIVSARGLLALNCVLLVASCGHSGRPSGPGAGDSPSGDVIVFDERLGFDDVVEVRVVGEPEISGDYRLGADGSVDYPYVGRIQLRGLRPGEVQRLLTEKLQEGYFRSPQIIVTVKEWNSRKLAVLGQVQKPGPVAYFPRMTIVDAIAAAGGFTEIAAKNSVSVRRESEGKVQTKSYRVADISEGRSPNVVIFPRDVIVVEERLF